jgi:hypothetical protein
MRRHLIVVFTAQGLPLGPPASSTRMAGPFHGTDCSPASSRTLQFIEPVEYNVDLPRLVCVEGLPAIT